MARRQSRISFRDSDKTELQRAVRNFNAKRRRLIRQNPELADVLPAKQSLSQARQEFTTRAEFNRTINSLQRFTKRGAEEVLTTTAGETVTRFELEEIKNLVRIENIRLARRRKELGVQTVRVKGELKVIDVLPSGRVLSQQEVARLSPTKFDIKPVVRGGKVVEGLVETRRDLAGFKAGRLKKVTEAGRQIRRSQYVNNYAIALGEVHDLNGSIEKRIIEVANQIDPDVVADAVRTNPALAIEYIYKEKDRPDILNRILNEWLFVLENQ